MQNIDFNFNIHPVSLAIGHLLSHDIKCNLIENNKPIEIKTFQFINGRERTLCLQVQRNWLDQEALYVKFGEDRNSGNIFVEHTTAMTVSNQPTLHGEKVFNEDTYRDRYYIGIDDFNEAVSYIAGLINNHLDIMQERAEAKEHRKQENNK
jgi:hypothetical protein